jgi:hypothetical protein
MQDFFQHFSDTYIKVSTGLVETLIQSQRGELFTGIMRLHYPSDEVLVLTFLDGVQQKLYRYQDNRMEAVPRQFWSNTLDRPDASIAFIKLSEEALRLLRVQFEAPVLKEEKSTFSRQELSSHVSNWAIGGSPSILRLQGENINKLYLIAGNSAPIIEELSWMEEEVHFSICDASFPNQLLSSECQVTRYVSDAAHDIWQEYELRFAFHLLMRFLLNRFSELAGRILAERLGEQLSQDVTDSRMNIKITINGVANHHYFNSMEDEIHVYFEILRRFREDAATAIGMRMADGLVRDTLFKLDVHQQDLLKRHIYDPYMLDRVTGVGWR